MKMQYEEFGLYNVSMEYMKYLYENIDSNVYYRDNPQYARKPFVGILIVLSEYKYFIPLTSRKPKFAFMPQVGTDYFVVFEYRKNKPKTNKAVFREFDNGKIQNILALIDIKKMIPVPNGVYKKVIFSDEADVGYKNLLMTEYQFCLKIKKDILDKAEKIYLEQKLKGKVHKSYCNFKKLEDGCDNYVVDNKVG